MSTRRDAGAFGFWLGAGLTATVFGLLTLGERRRPLRRTVEPRLRHLARNLAVAGVSAAAVQVFDRPITRRAAALVEERGWGLLSRARLPRWLADALAFLLLDYTLWVWHVLLHRWTPLWRLHAVHHADLDLDASTGVRFHPLELIASVPWRVAQVIAIGARPRALGSWHSALFLSILFHHSNLRLPLALERRLALVMVTPRQHGIHHSVVDEERDSNWSSLLNVWDRLHGTLRLDVAQEAITIGLPALRDPREVSLARLAILPLAWPRAWALPGTALRALTSRRNP
jgi:sterol desaturase/sphingolipid hydroxylase (fatty acid hydroxylase superfamily)